MRAPRRLWRGEGCHTCAGSGYRGRIGIYEFLYMDERFHDPIVRGPDMLEIMRLAREIGMQSIAEDGMQKALQGVTTLEEVLRVSGG